MKIIIVLISVEYDNARKVCNLIENTTFKGFDELKETLRKELRPKPSNSISLFYEISDFMEAVNDQELDVLTEYFISYVKFEK